MPGKVKVRIISARGLPVMDRSSDLADAFAEVKLGNVVHKTEVCKKSLNPVWNSEWYRFEVDDEELQEEPLQLRVMDYDTYTAHDAIGKVNISLNCLLSYESPRMLSGWFPIYDTMHGIRGEIQIEVKVDFFVDTNKFRQSSCGVLFFTTPSVPCCYKALAFHGFVEELVVNDDPEYQWIDNFRTTRSSNEARQRLFQKLSGELQRKIGLKVLDLGGNAVIGYQQYFDLEGESGIVVRGIGTCVLLLKINATSSLPTTPTGFIGSPRDEASTTDKCVAGTPKSNPINVKRMRHNSTTDSDGSSPKKDHNGSGDYGSFGKSLGRPWIPGQNTTRQRLINELEFPFFTLTKLPSSILRSIGGVVSARSVKLLDRINNPDEPETRDSWWREIRTEIRSHANSLGCNAVIGYSESSSICEELIVLSGIGTAAFVMFDRDLPTVGKNSGVPQTDSEGNSSKSALLSTVQLSITPPEENEYRSNSSCSICHIPYVDDDVPMPVHLTKCLVCKQNKVPDMLFSTTELPCDLAVVGRGCILQGRVCRIRRKEKGEVNAELTSNILPFLEYELHRQLTNKLKLKGMNALFGLQVQVSVGESMIIALGTGTALYLACLPPAPILRVVGKVSTAEEERRLKNIQKKILEYSARSRVSFGIDKVDDSLLYYHHESNFDGDTTSDTMILDPSLGNKEAFVVEIDDQQDEDVITDLFDTPIPKGFICGTTEAVPGVDKYENRMQMITALKRIAVNDENSDRNKLISKLFESIVQSFWFKVRRLSPCSISNIRFDLEIPMADSVQVAVNAYVIGCQTREDDDRLPSRMPADHHGKGYPRAQFGLLRIGKPDDLDLQFEIEDEWQTTSQSPVQSTMSKDFTTCRSQNRIRKTKDVSCSRPLVELTPTSCVVGGVTERYLGNINLFFIRESLSVRENGGLNNFIQVFIGEVHAIVRAQVLALGGNALTSFRMNKVVLLDSPHKNQGQILLNVCGDVVEVNFRKDM
ncbi:C2 domain-containing protein 5-like [Xenia sp. Carnegie-2017]|uniref:C2 domain-containing protein 5-like n=1 Tax=Xenia sp. Carnegie-2017 TaxID=2897299 RepID=UPI001F03D401|nr:C2 domain-containing protein 5-like [Xenia sp. Carnegie-2017]